MSLSNIARFSARRATTASMPSLLAGSQARGFHRSVPTEQKVAVVGAAGGIGQPLSLLMKLNKNVTELSCFDLAPFTPGVATDISHINTPAKASGFTGEALGDSLKDADVVIIPAGVPRKPGMTRQDLFNTNASIVAGIVKEASKNCPNAALLIISNPVNSTVPIAAEVLKRLGTYDKTKLFGVTTLDVCRANTFVAENQSFDVNKTNVTVVGGHAGVTILPLLSQIPQADFSDEDRDALTHRIMFGGDEVVQAKAGAGSATLSMAYAGAVFADLVLRARAGEKGIVAMSYVDSDLGYAPFFSSPITLGKDGISKINDIGPLSDFEKEKLAAAIPELEKSIAEGVDFAKNFEL